MYTYSTGYTRLHYINLTLLVLPNTQYPAGMQWILSGEGMGGSCDALLMPADISEQTESIRAKGSIAKW